MTILSDPNGVNLIIAVVDSNKELNKKGLDKWPKVEEAKRKLKRFFWYVRKLVITITVCVVSQAVKNSA